METTFAPAILKPILESSKPLPGAAFTVVSQSTGKDFTFKLTRYQPAPGVPVKTLVYVEKGYLDFFYLGVYKAGKITKKGADITTSSAVAAAWLLSKVEAGQEIPKAKFFHLGKCLVCGRTLTDAESIKYGIGPKCRK